jgi:hypothetical protein
MDYKLDKSKLNYVLFHLKQHIEISTALEDLFLFDNLEDDKNNSHIIFPQSENPLNIDNIIYINNIPVLFPIKNTSDIYTIKGSSVLFNHDFCKSAFYLLSGIQEMNNFSPDDHGRFPYSASIQHRLNIIQKPIVNYYFEFIIKGIKEFGKLNGIDIKQKKQPYPFTFFLSHDIDSVNKYNICKTIYKTKELLGIKKTSVTKIQIIKSILLGLVYLFKGQHSKNPFWNFNELIALEKEHNMKSTFFFLPNHNYKVDSCYSLENKKIKQTIQYICNKGFEVGVHSPIGATTNEQVLTQQLKRVQDISPKPIVGNRQHFLSYKHTTTLKLLEKAGIQYDTTLGFAEFDGFRNSYCFPFHPFDFENNQMMKIWEIPLVLMDATLFKYRKLNFDQAKKSIMTTLDEIIQFGGVFSLLWHNSYLDNYEVPGIYTFYKDLLKMIEKRNPLTLTGEEWINTNASK